MKFLLSEFTLWDKSMGSPRHTSDADGNAGGQRADGRFASGKYDFPFSFPFPTYANAIKGGTASNTSSISPVPTIAVGSVRNNSPFSTFPLNDTPRNLETQKRTLWVSRPTSAGSPSPTDAEATPFSPISPTSQTHLSLSCPLPQSFLERGVNSTVFYDLLVRIDHGRFRGSSK